MVATACVKEEKELGKAESSFDCIVASWDKV
jgi:hypothetical protein